MLRLRTNLQDRTLEMDSAEPIRVSFDQRRPINQEWQNKELNAFNRASLAMQLFPNVKNEESIDAILSLIPENVPNEVDILSNIREAESMMLKEFYDAVRNKGQWDYKQLGKQYEEFGNWHFGIAAKAFGFPEVIARAGAGLAQMIAGTSPEGPLNLTNLFKEPFGDDLPDQEAIGRGFRTYDMLKEPNYSKDTMKESNFSNERLRLSEPKSDQDSQGTRGTAR